jgi:hypothetical protein
MFIPGGQFYITYHNGDSQLLPFEVKVTSTTSVHKDHFSTIKPLLFTQQPDQAERHPQLNTKKLWCRGVICTHTTSFRGPLLLCSRQNLTGKILNFAPYFCFVCMNFLLPMPHAFATCSCNYAMHV